MSLDTRTKAGAALYGRFKDAIGLLYCHGLLSDAEHKRAYLRLAKMTGALTPALRKVLR